MKLSYLTAATTTAAGCSSRPSDMTLLRLGKRTSSDVSAFPSTQVTSSTQRACIDMPILDRMHDNHPKLGSDEDQEKKLLYVLSRKL
ncbi:hypothetical protein PGT21_029490 [Puccinia graminis f. sp. tritici]|uniref:Uncharacterized protein n=1 Tax=Puccinia graminis f. sp. tritici TaxID=56615 RepID=A0A5B0MXT7_PUCGR|nr:hypothetical protein PGT21_029490 [Puccinia graminis f. sp. tritici]